MSLPFALPVHLAAPGIAIPIFPALTALIMHPHQLLIPVDVPFLFMSLPFARLSVENGVEVAVLLDSVLRLTFTLIIESHLAKFATFLELPDPIPETLLSLGGIVKRWRVPTIEPGNRGKVVHGFGAIEVKVFDALFLLPVIKAIGQALFSRRIPSRFLLVRALSSRRFFLFMSTVRFRLLLVSTNLFILFIGIERPSLPSAIVITIPSIINLSGRYSID